MKQTISVAVGIIYNSVQEILVTWRPAHKNQGGCWEFPGGKIETGEECYQGLCRELQEEIGITVLEAQSLPSIHYSYESYDVILYPWRVTAFSGNAKGLEGQQLFWTTLSQLPELKLPAANHLLVDFLLQEHAQALETTNI